MNLKEEYISVKRSLFDKYYAKLNDMQRKAVYTVNGPVLILAGAGSGKTTVLVTRIAHIIRYGDAYFSEYVPDSISSDNIDEMKSALNLNHDELGEYLTKFSINPAPAWSVLGITFTNKAANEIKNRIVSLFGEESSEAAEINTGTFHSVCCKILRRWGELIGYDRSFSICDTADSKKLISDCMKKLNIDEKTLPSKSVLNAISRAKDKLLTPSDMAAEAGIDVKQKKIAEIYKMYSERLKSQNLLDFDDIIMATVELLSKHAEVRNTLQKRYRYVCVDEYQDTNYAQLKLTLLLSDFYKNIMVVGDDDQSIYKFRGAVIENILNFDKNYDNTKVIRLEENYRSTQTILDAANSVISNNSGRLGKTLWTSSGKGEKIVINNLQTQIDEAKYISEIISEHINEGKGTFKDFAVLYRMNAQSRSIEQAFVKSAIPYRVLGGLRFFDRMEIKDIVSYLHVINNPMDDVRLSRIVNTPRRGIGGRSYEIAETLAYEEGFSLLEFMRSAKKYKAISPTAANSMQNLAYTIDSLREAAEELSVSELIIKTIDVTGYGKMLNEMTDHAERDERLSNIEELINAARQYEDDASEPSLFEFLEDVALVSDVDKYDEEADAVVLMTIHSAKGLEFPIVFLPGMEENIFPGYQTIMNPEEIEEERRLAYVAITRAKRKLYITHVNNRMMNGHTQINMISRFASEIPESLIERPENNFSFTQSRHTSSALGRQVNASMLFSSEKAQPSIRNVKKNVKKSPSETFAVGDNVSHPMFGKGVILSAKPMGGDTLYEIVFESYGTKRLMATYAKLKKA